MLSTDEVQNNNVEDFIGELERVIEVNQLFSLSIKKMINYKIEKARKTTDNSHSLKICINHLFSAFRFQPGFTHNYILPWLNGQSSWPKFIDN